jgi:hypothetical protein
MPTNLPSSFASAAAGQNANSRGGRADGRGATSGDWLVFTLVLTELLCFPGGFSSRYNGFVETLLWPSVAGPGIMVGVVLHTVSPKCPACSRWLWCATPCVLRSAWLVCRDGRLRILGHLLPWLQE